VLIYWGSVKLLLSPVKLYIGGLQQIAVSWTIYSTSYMFKFCIIPLQYAELLKQTSKHNTHKITSLFSHDITSIIKSTVKPALCTIYIMIHNYISHVSIWFNKQVKQYLVRAWIGPNGYKSVRFPELLDSRHMKVARLLVLGNGRLYPPRRHPWYSFLLEAGSTPGSQCGRKD
jgi:hypothetical protein